MIIKSILLLTGEKNIYSLFDNMNANGLRRIIVISSILGGIFFLLFSLILGHIYLFITS